MRISDCWYESVCTNDCSQSCIRYLEMRHLMEHSNIPKARQTPTVLQAPRCDYDAFKRLSEIKNSIKYFVETGCNFYITSSTTGNGKTSWAIKLMLKYFDYIWAGNGFKTRGIFVHIPTFLLKCKDFGNKDAEFEEMKKQLPEVDLVIWDDIASTDLSSYDLSQLLMYIDQRVLNEKSNIYTGNITDRDTMTKILGNKLTSRVMSNTTEIIEFKGGDKR